MQLVLLFILLSSSFIFATGRANNDDGGFRDTALEAHNNFRSKLKLHPLQLDSGINLKAQDHAEKLASELKFYKSGSGGYAKQENLWAYYGKLRRLSLDCKDATNSWYTGSEYPGFILVETNQHIIRCNETTIFGIGVGTNEVGYTVVVANYL